MQQILDRFTHVQESYCMCQYLAMNTVCAKNSGMQAIRPGYWQDMADKLSSIHPTQVHTLPGHHFGYMERPDEVINILDRVLA